MQIPTWKWMNFTSKDILELVIKLDQQKKQWIDGGRIWKQWKRDVRGTQVVAADETNNQAKLTFLAL